MVLKGVKGSKRQLVGPIPSINKEAMKPRPRSFIFRSRQTALWYLVYTPLLIVGPPSFVLPIVAAGLVTLFGVQREELLLWVIGFSTAWAVLVCHYAFRGDLSRLRRGEKLLD